MPAVVRVKRRIDEEPLNAFVLNGKKRRLDGPPEEAGGEIAESLSEAGKDEISTILKFAGTLNEQDDTATTQFARRLTKDEAQALVQQKTRKAATNHTERARAEMRQSLHENRFRVVNCLRTTLEADEDANAKEITIVDIEKQSTPTASTSANATSSTTLADLEQQPSDSDTGYVYDLYLPENEQQANDVDLMDDNYLSVRAFDNLIYEDRFNDEDEEYDSEDSNQENYAGNDYPDEDDDMELNGDIDEDDDESEDDRELRAAVKKFVLDDDDEDEEAAGYDDSSSDGEDCNPYQDPYVHTVDVEQGFVDDVDDCDVDRYGMAYARYKARVLKKLKGNAEGAEADDDGDDDKNKSDSDERYHSASENEEYFD